MNRLPALKNFSATQIEAFKNCQRLWYFGSIEKDRRPPTPAQRRGSDIHKLLENYLYTGNIQPHGQGYHRYIEWLVPHLPERTESLAIEQEIRLDVETGLPLPINTGKLPPDMFIKGFIDLGVWSRLPPLIGDLKTTSDFRYAKTPAELRINTQLNIYTRWVLGIEPGLDKVKVGHWYLKVSKTVPKTTRSKKVLPVFTEITRTANQECWERDLGVMREMEKAGYADSAQELPPNINHCPAYGGCQYKDRCGVDVQKSLFTKPETSSKKGSIMGFLDKVKATTGGNNGQTAPASFSPPPPQPPPPAVEARSTPSPAVQEPTIIPPDGAPRETPPEISEEIRSKAEESAEKKTKKKTTRKAKHKRTCTLYINCHPMKGEHQKDAVFVEDWIRDIHTKLNEHVKERGLVDYRLLPFQEEKIALSHGVQAKIEQEGLPEVLVVQNMLSVGIIAEVVELLKVHASDVISAIR